MKKLSQLNEGAIGDIIKRAVSTEDRMEDYSEFKKVSLQLKKTYTEIQGKINAYHDGANIYNDIDIPIYVRPDNTICHLCLIYLDEQHTGRLIDVYMRRTDIKKYPKLFDEIHSNYHIQNDKQYSHIMSESMDALSGDEIIGLIDTILKYVKNPALKRVINEGVIGDIIKRSVSSEEREEDKFNPEYIDFGPDTTVYWAKNNLNINGENRFYFNDVKDYNNNGWRLPTVEEVKQIDWTKKDISWFDGCLHLRILTNPWGGKVLGTFLIDMDDCNEFGMWTKDKDPRFPNDIFEYGYYNSHKFDIYSTSGTINNLYVLLVKDK